MRTVEQRNVSSIAVISIFLSTVSFSTIFSSPKRVLTPSTVTVLMPFVALLKRLFFSDPCCLAAAVANKNKKQQNSNNANKKPKSAFLKEARELVSQDSPAIDFPGSSSQLILPCMQEPQCICVTARLHADREVNQEGQIASNFLIKDSW